MANLKGQDITLSIVVDGALKSELGNNIVSLEVNEDGELIEDEFLGDTASTFDHVFKGWRLTLTTQTRSTEWEDFCDAMRKAMQYQPGGAVQVDIIEARRYPDTGVIETMTYQNVKRAPVRRSAGSRTDRVTFEMELACRERIRS